MKDDEEVRRFREFMESAIDCKCFDSYEEFDKCCGKKYGIINPVNILFKMVSQMSKSSIEPRLKDMEPEQANKTLEKVFKILDDRAS